MFTVQSQLLFKPDSWYRLAPKHT